MASMKRGSFSRMGQISYASCMADTRLGALEDLDVGARQAHLSLRAHAAAVHWAGFSADDAKTSLGHFSQSVMLLIM
jgi:hypothetical protein